MNILLLGSGGREHAIAWKLAQSPLLKTLYIAPGNAGTSSCGINVPISVNDFGKIKEFVLEKEVAMVLVGPEEPLVKGIHDFFLADEKLSHIPVIGPVAKAAMLEGSKEFAKEFMIRHHIPTAKHRTFTIQNLSEGADFIKNSKAPIVLKADGLAAGKGVVILHDKEEAIAELNSMIGGKKFGEASARVVIEEFLSGIELSVFVITDGDSYKILPEAKDYKRIGESDTGPNTGGMGSVSPVPFADQPFMEKVESRIIIPTIEGLKKEGIPYCGFVFFGLINVNGDPFVIEYNCRMGDPETESVMLRIGNDLVELLIAVAEKRLCKEEIIIKPERVATVMLVSQGYPEQYEKGKIINIDPDLTGSLVFHAGTAISPETEDMITNGGRVIAVTSIGASLSEAVNTSVTNAGKVHFEGKYFRKDIGFDL